MRSSSAPLQITSEDDRRSFLSNCGCGCATLFFLSPMLGAAAPPAVAIMEDMVPNEAEESSSSSAPVSVAAAAADFHSAAFGLEEYNNSIVASRDTNISPKEVYDTISSDYLRNIVDGIVVVVSDKESEDNTNNNNNQRRNSSIRSSKQRRNKVPKALDVGAGAGVSTEILYRMGYHTIDALDWSGKAWEKYVVNDPGGYCPPSVQFYELDDERYLENWRKKYYGNKHNNIDNEHPKEEEDEDGLFDAIVFNFAINESKAITFATELLNKDHGVLLAPVNTSTDYWLKQRYKVIDASGKVLWSTDDVGAWSVLFQPDVTQDTVRERESGELALP
jgi:hypothetical protein